MTTEKVLAKKDFVSDQEVRWCPGCGDYAILNAVQQVLPTLGIPRERFVMVSGIGCSSRFPYYMNTYGIHSIHGRAPAIATGIKIANPELSVWVATGDGDGMSIGGNHLIHVMRRNVDMHIILFNNRIYGLTKGQASPTSVFGQKTKSTPYGTVDHPFNPLALTLGAGATFVARCVDVNVPHMKKVLTAAAEHHGTSFIEVFQNCNIFNNGAFAPYRDKNLRDDHVVELRHGEPLIFGKNRDRGIRITRGGHLEVVTLGDGVTEKDLVVHDEQGPPGYAALLAHMEPPEFPVPIGVLHRVEKETYEEAVHHQVEQVTAEKGEGDLKELIYSGEIWEVT